MSKLISIPISEKAYNLLQQAKRELSTDDGIIEMAINMHMMGNKLLKAQRAIAVLRKQNKSLKEKLNAKTTD